MPGEEVKIQQAEPEVKEPAAPAATEDETGLGLGNFLTTPSPETDEGPAGKAEEEKKTPEDTKGGDEDVGKEPVKSDVKSDVKKPDEKVAAAPEGGEKKDDTPSPDAAKEAAKADAKKDGEPKVEDKPKVDYESPDNPYIKRHRDTQSWATDLNKRLQDVERRSVMQQKKLDGTFDEDKDNPQPTAEDKEAEGEAKGRAKASREAAVSQFGEDETAKDLQKFYDIFGDDPYVQGSVMSMSSPVMGAIGMLRRHEFFEEFGYEPKEIIEKIGKKKEAELRATIQEEEAAKLASRIKTVNGEPAGLAGLTAKSNDSTTEKAKGPTSLKAMFDN